MSTVAALREAADFLDTLDETDTRTVHVTLFSDNQVWLYWQHHTFTLPRAEQSALARRLVRTIDAEWTRRQYGSQVQFEAHVGRLRLAVDVDAAVRDAAVQA